MDVYDGRSSEPIYVKVEGTGGIGVVAYEPEQAEDSINFENEGLVLEGYGNEDSPS